MTSRAERDQGRTGDRSPGASRRALLVTGMHRSGTSAVARVLSLLGADLPRHLIPPAPDNVAGFWESREIVAVHDRLLAAAGSDWYDPFPLPAAWLGSDAVAGFAREVLEILERDFSSSRLFVLKDPRICRLVPFWLSILESFGARPLFVLCVRNPLEVAASLAVRDGLSAATSDLLWLWHLLEAERHTRGRRRTFVLYEDLLADWRPAAARMRDELGADWPPPSPEVIAQIESFLSDRHRHHRSGDDDLESTLTISPSVKRVWAALSGASRDADGLAATLDAVRGELLVADALGPVIADLRRRWSQVSALDRKVAELEGKLAEVDREVADLGARMTAEIAEVRATADHARGLVDSLWSSKPWRAYLRLGAWRRSLFGGRGKRPAKPGG